MKLPDSTRRFTSWLGSHRRTIIVVFAVTLLVQVTGQLVYPHERALPFAKLQGRAVGAHKRADIVRQVQQDFYTAKATLRAGQLSQTVALSQLGATVNADAMAAELTEYSLTERLLPFSLFLKKPNVPVYEVDFNNQQLSKEAAAIAKKLSLPPLDAALAISDGELVVTSSRNGQTVKISQLKMAITAAKYSSKKTTIAATVSVAKPQVSDASIAAVRQQAEAVLARTITIVVTDSGQVVQASAPEIAKLLKIENKPDGQAIQLAVNKSAVADYVEKVWSQSKVEPEPTTIKLVDGKVSSEDSGQSGLGINRQYVVDELSTRLLDGQAEPVYVQYQPQPIASPVSYQREYTASQQGLRAYIADVTASGNIKVSITQLGGAAWTASGGANDSIPSASTYKLFIMLRVFEEIESGKMNWGSNILDTNAGECFERTIVVSTNSCSEEWLRQFGRKPMNSFIQSKGFSRGTLFPDDGAARTTAADLNKFLVQLESGSLVSGQNRTMLLDKMSRQIYRRGVPAGTGAKAYDKVGFLWDYVHDAAIVRHPKGTYVIVVMTKGSSYDRIAEITRQVERILYK